MVDERGTRHTKRASESRNYGFDFGTVGDTSIILQAPLAVAVTPQAKVTEVAALVAGTPTSSGAVLTVRLSGGTDGELYKLVATADDGGGNSLEMAAWLEVEDVPDTTNLEVEDGTAKTNADSYVSLTDADLYWSKRNNNTWLGKDQAEKEAALREATRFIDGRYGWLGEIQSPIQALDWPRYEVTDDDGRILDPGVIPPRVKDATCEAALMALTGSLLPATDRGGAIKRARVGPIDVTYEDRAEPHRSFDWIDIILSGLYVSRGQRGRRLMRA